MKKSAGNNYTVQDKIYQESVLQNSTRQKRTRANSIAQKSKKKLKSTR